MARSLVTGPRRSAVSDAYGQGRNAGLQAGYDEGYFRGNHKASSTGLYTPRLCGISMSCLSAREKDFPIRRLTRRLLARRMAWYVSFR